MPTTAVVTGATVNISQTTYPGGFTPNQYGGNYSQPYPPQVAGQPSQNAPPMQPYPPNAQIPAQVPPAYSEIEKQAALPESK